MKRVIFTVNIFAYILLQYFSTSETTADILELFFSVFSLQNVTKGTHQSNSYSLNALFQKNMS